MTTAQPFPFPHTKLDAFQDDLVNYLFGKVGLEEGRKILRKFGFHGVWAEIGEEYLGAAARSGVARLEGDQGELFQEWSGSLPETFDSRSRRRRRSRG